MLTFANLVPIEKQIAIAVAASVWAAK